MVGPLRVLFVIAALFSVGAMGIWSLPLRVHGRVFPANVAVPEAVADVKTCGCPKTASCGDCCGQNHCPCKKPDPKGPTSRDR